MNEMFEHAHLPKLIDDCIKTIFNFPDKKICAQVATQSGDTPTIRTMKLVDVTDKGELIFLSNIDTQKWRDLNTNPKVAVAIFDQILGVQLVSRGEATLDTTSSNEAKVHHYWKIVRPSVKKLFYEKSQLIQELIPPVNFGVITILPQYWEILSINQKDYDLSTRFCFTRRSEGWQKKQCQVNS